MRRPRFVPESKHASGRRYAKNWRRAKKRKRKISKASRRRNR